MHNLPQSHTDWRTPRVRLTDTTPVVLRLRDGGGCHRGKLETISLTGGLLSLPEVLSQGSRISLVFLTDSGPVLGTAEMLSPVSTEQQPFRFIALERDDQCRLRTIVQPLPNRVEEDWIAKYRAALVQQNRKRGGLPRIVLRSLSLLVLLSGAVYLLHLHLVR
jgi:hypothetical protein